MHDFVFEFSSSFVSYCFVLTYFIENPMILMSLPLTHDSASRKSTQSPRHHSTRNPSPTSVPILTKKTSLQNNTALNIANRELVFRQLTEQLWAAGLPSSTTGCSMSICSRCSSAPPSECGGREDETTKTDWNNDGHAAEANIDWDEPDIPDEGKSSCVKFLLFLMLASLVRTYANIY